MAEDAISVGHAAVSTWMEAVGGALSERYTWSAVKLYYSLFYSIRALLMLNGWSVFYISNTPHALRATPGTHVVKKGGNTHTAVAKLFRGELASDLIISQDINSEDPIKWLEDIRNAHSYKLAPFPDPAAPAYFAKFAARPRAVIAAYLRDPLALAFDPEHAIVAYPLLALSHLDAEIARLGLAPNILIENHCIKNLSAHQCFVAEFRTTFSRIQFGPAA